MANSLGNSVAVFPVWTLEWGSEMIANILTCDEFRKLVERHFAFLPTYGFKRAPEYEESLPLLCAVVYIGKHIAFEIYLDVRDHYVGLDVVKVMHNMPKTLSRGGFSVDLGVYLRKRGLYKKTPSPPVVSSIEQSLIAWAELLRERGQLLLGDSPEALKEDKT